MIDSCFHLKKNNSNYIRSISNKITASKINKALCYFDNEKTNTDRKLFIKNCNKYNNIIPVTYLKYTNNMKKEIYSIVSCKYKFVKIHPRFLNIKFNNRKFYVNVFRLISKTNLRILWCTFDGWENSPNEINQLDFLAKLINLIPQNKIVLMHGGGPNLLKYYERFRFIENVYIDLSYTLIQYRNTTIEKDIIFLIKKFDKRLLFGSDYPVFDLKEYLQCFKEIIKKSKIKKDKLRNLERINLLKLLND
jgi:predicted TIM-barrel fold metal-dependent hydrolase